MASLFVHDLHFTVCLPQYSCFYFSMKTYLLEEKIFFFCFELYTVLKKSVVILILKALITATADDALKKRKNSCLADNFHKMLSYFSEKLQNQFWNVFCYKFA